LLNRNVVLIRGARQLVTLRGPREARRGHLLRELNIISDGAVLIRDGIVADVGPSRRVEHLAAARNVTEIDATGRVVMPAFVDALARVAFAHTPVPSDEEILSGAGRLLPPITPECARALNSIPRPRLEARCRLVVEDMLRHGTGTVEAQTGFGLDDSAELKALRVYRALDGHPVDLLSTYTPRPLSPDRSPERILHTIAHRKLAHFVDVCCAPDGFTAHHARKFLHIARGLGLGLKLQAPGPAPDEVVALAVELGAISIGHLNLISDADIGFIAESTVIATLCPGAAYQSGTGRFAPARALIQSGAAVSLASNFNAGSSPFYSMPFILALACRHMCMTPAEAITAATINAAYATGCGARTGSLEPGKQADLIVCNAHDYREIPHYAGSNPVHMTMKKGAIVHLAARVGVA
jgi:imidazolonepropionase